MIHSPKIRKAARGEQCTLQIVGTCCHDPATVVFAHLPSENNGMGTKSSDLCGCFACRACHDMIDGRTRPSHEFAEHKDWYLLRAYRRTMERLWQLEILRIA